jgi:hypothetical protein
MFPIVHFSLMTMKFLSLIRAFAISLSSCMIFGSFYLNIFEWVNSPYSNVPLFASLIGLGPNPYEF